MDKQLKAGIMTFHCAHNYGAMLQCVALQRVLTDLGGDVEVIAYEPEYLTSGNRIYVSPIKQFSLAKKAYASQGTLFSTVRGVMSLSKAMLSNLRSKDKREKYRKFEAFKSKHMHLSEPIHEIGDLAVLKDRYDIIVCGSDQIWNPKITKGSLDPAYFGAFSGDNTIVISYAASACDFAGSGQIDRFKELTANMLCVSLREAQIYDAVKDLIKVPARIDVDPTLLLFKEQYQPFEEKIHDHGNYILIYTLNDPQSRAQVEDKVNELFSRNQNLQVIDISYDMLKPSGVPGNKYVYRAAISPGEFLSYIKNAEYVVTNSFHGTSFSIIYEKEFWTAVHSSRGVRMTNLLKSLDLSDRLLPASDIVPAIDYAVVGKLRKSHQKNSLDYLRKSYE